MKPRHSGSFAAQRILGQSPFSSVCPELDATLEMAADCSGFVFAVGNHIPSNVPIENARFYIDYLRRNWVRQAQPRA